MARQTNRLNPDTSLQHRTAENTASLRWAIRATVPFADLPEFMVRLKKGKGPGAQALKLIVHTAARTLEVLEARWSEFDLAAGIWTIPAERMKAGKQHWVPLSQPVVSLLKALPQTADDLFPDEEGSKPLSDMAIAMTLAQMDPRDWTIHAFRASFCDWCKENTEFPREFAEQVLALQPESEIQGAHRREDALSTHRALMDQWSAFLGSAEA